MSETIETTTTAAVRPRLFDGLMTPKQLEEETGWGWRTILRREADGLPVIVIGGTKLYPADKVRAWIMGRLRQREAPRRGRPRKAA
jgi:hypothetical protein